MPGVHTKKVSAEQQLEAALDGLAFLARRRVRQGRNQPDDDDGYWP